VQLDGGIAKALDKIEAWFTDKLAALPTATRILTDLGALAVGLMSAAPIGDAAAVCARVRHTHDHRAWRIRADSASDALLANPSFRGSALGSIVPRATLAYGQPLTQSGLHIIASETDHWVENLTGLGACVRAHLALTLVSEHARQGHPLLPVIQVAQASQRGVHLGDDIDLFLTGSAGEDQSVMEALLIAVAELERTPAANAQGFVDFQFTRGLLGVTS